MMPLVAIVGRPNVGKSTLFNRLARKHVAIVEDQPGVTRDRHYADTEWGDYRFTLIDTGGFVPGIGESLDDAVFQQVQAAIEECDVLLFVVDGRAGRSGGDEEVATFLRKSGKPVLVVVNKVDSPKQEGTLASEFYRLGLGEPFEVSAEHDRGTVPLVEALLEHLPTPEPVVEPSDEEGMGEGPDDNAPIRVSIIGRPNVGKSTLINALLGKKRLVVSPMAGTTRDPIDSALTVKGREYVLTDTAGIRRKSTISQRVEQYSVLAALKAVDRSDVTVLVMDATEPAVDQDAKLAGITEEKGRPLLIVVNKWDQVSHEPKKEEAFRAELKHQLRFVAYAPVIFTSALHGQKIGKVLEMAQELYRQFHYRAATPQLNKLLEHITTEHPAPFANGKALRLYYVAQVASAPPTFVFRANMPDEVPDRYKRYIVNQLRSTFDLRVPLRMYFRERPGKGKREAALQRMRARANSKAKHKH